MGRNVGDVIVTKEWTTLESSSIEHKAYAPGIGQIMETKGGDQLELIEVH